MTTVHAYTNDQRLADVAFSALDQGKHARRHTTLLGRGDDRFGEGWSSVTEDGDDVDLMPELYAGRAPVSTPAEAAVFVDKTLRYEQQSATGNGYPASTLFLAERLSQFIDGAEVAVVAYGFTARAALAAVKRLRAEGLAAGLLRLKTLWPFPAAAVQALGDRCETIFVPEMNHGQVAGEVRKAARRAEVVPFAQTNGEVITSPTVERSAMAVSCTSGRKAAQPSDRTTA